MQNKNIELYKELIIGIQQQKNAICVQRGLLQNEVKNLVRQNKELRQQMSVYVQRLNDRQKQIKKLYGQNRELNNVIYLMRIEYEGVRNRREGLQIIKQSRIRDRCRQMYDLIEVSNKKLEQQQQQSGILFLKESLYKIKQQLLKQMKQKQQFMQRYTQIQAINHKLTIQNFKYIQQIQILKDKYTSLQHKYTTKQNGLWINLFEKQAQQIQSTVLLSQNQSLKQQINHLHSQLLIHQQKSLQSQIQKQVQIYKHQLQKYTHPQTISFYHQIQSYKSHIQQQLNNIKTLLQNYQSKIFSLNQQLFKYKHNSNHKTSNPSNPSQKNIKQNPSKSNLNSLKSKIIQNKFQIQKIQNSIIHQNQSIFNRPTLFSSYHKNLHNQKVSVDQINRKRNIQYFSPRSKQKLSTYSSRGSQKQRWIELKHKIENINIQNALKTANLIKK